MFELNGVPVWMELLGWVLVHFLGEGAVIAFVAWAGLACMRRASAQARYLILCGALLACAIAPCATWALLAGGVRGSAGPIAISTGSETAMPAATSFMADGPLPGGNPGIWLRGSTPHSASIFERLATAIQARLPHLVMLWGLGVMILSLRLVHGWIQLRALRASGTPATDQAWVRRLHALAERMGVRRAIRLLESARVEVPTVIGWLKPLLLLPVGFLAGLPPEQAGAGERLPMAPRMGSSRERIPGPEQSGRKTLQRPHGRRKRRSRRTRD